jgi:hypothetical protein
LNILIKLMAILSLIFASKFNDLHKSWWLFNLTLFMNWSIK